MSVQQTSLGLSSTDMDEDAIHAYESLFKAEAYGLDPLTDGGGRSRLSAVAKFKSAAKSIKDYKKGEAETIRRVLDEIELISVKRMSEGFNEFNFSVGVFNCVSRHYLCSDCPLSSFFNKRCRGDVMRIDHVGSFCNYGDASSL